ncbi:phosphate ABC transporter permease subunit PstC [Chondromyces crocatus]|uniref:Phosphate transport system permease protein n=1 Tax=Chondromyces crocatus TaxID=52 RepID=A0A0K1EKS8_CHOCO|nr:phosphate ABC transporter permease subunit PstC [Chondromyces crocatus]AKT41441.1 phosphate ABC transporter permease [Chondromyces crocatus]
MKPDLARDLRRPSAPSERAAKLVFSLCAAVSLLTTLGIVAVLLQQTLGFLQAVSLRQIFADVWWTPRFAEPRFGIWPLVCGTLLTTAIAMIVAIPLGLLAAIYLSELAGPRQRRLLKPLLELLAGVPTLVYGYFALTLVTPALQRVLPGLSSFNALSAGAVMGLMILPLVASLSEAALHAVPMSLREASYALGVRKLPTLFHVVIPSAFSGIAAAVLLGVSRAIGETMVVTIAAGQQPQLTLDPRVSIETMTSYIAQVSLGDTPTGTLEYKTVFAVGLCLFTMTLVLNVLSYRLRRHLRRGERA